MGATLIISNEPKAAWMPRAGTFDTILELLANVLDPINSSLANTIRRPIGGFPFLDISMFDEAAYNDLIHATTQVERHLAEKQNDTLTNKGLFSAFGELVILLNLDKRCPEQRYAGAREIIVDDKVVWHQPTWIYVLVLNYLSEFALRNSRELSLFFQRAQDKPLCDLRDLDRVRAKHLAETMEMLNLTLGEGRSVGGTSAFKESYPAARQLYGLFKAHFNVTGIEIESDRD